MSEKNPHLGSTLEDFLHEEGIYDSAKAEAVTRVTARTLTEAIKELPLDQQQEIEAQAACLIAAEKRAKVIPMPEKPV